MFHPVTQRTGAILAFPKHAAPARHLLITRYINTASVDYRAPPANEIRLTHQFFFMYL